jgi:hypothetical protein
MDPIKSILTKPAQPANKNIHSEAHFWADTISSAFGEKKKFGMYLGIINRIGVNHARQIFAEIQDSHAQSPGKLFMWKSRQTTKV